MGERRRLGHGNARKRRGAPPANSPSTRQARVAAGEPRDTGRTTHGAERAGASDRAVVAWPCLARVALLSFAAALAACDGSDKNPSPSEPPAALTVSAGTGGSLRAGGLVHVVVGSVFVDDIAAGSSGSVDVAGGSDVALTAVPSAGYRFAGWTLSGGLACESGADANPCVLAAGSVGPDATVSAAFEAGDLLVFDDAVGARWDLGIGAHDGLRAGDCMGGDSASCGNVSWAIVAAADPARGEVLEISHGDLAVNSRPVFSRVYLRSSAGQDLSGYDDGELRFDIMVASQGSGGSTPTFQIRVDCLPRCGSADHAVGAVGAEGWQTVAVNLRRDLIGTANAQGMTLDLSAVDTGLVIWPTAGMQAGVVFRLDNIVWDASAEMSAPPAEPEPSPAPGPARLMGMPELSGANAGVETLLPGQSLSFTLRTVEAVLEPSVTARLAGRAAGAGAPALSVTGGAGVWTATYTVPVGGPYGELAFDIILRNLQGVAADAVSFTPKPTITTNAGWGEPVWSDEFDGDALDTDRWEVQAHAEVTVSVGAGVLSIAASDKLWIAQAANVLSKDLQDFRYGRIEARARLPSGAGTKSAIWMLSPEARLDIRPLSGEIGIARATSLGVDGNTAVWSVLYFGLPAHGENPDRDRTFATHDPGATNAPQDDFHVYAAEWEAGEIRFYFDETHYATMTAADTWHGVAERSTDTLTSDQGRYALAGDGAPFDQAFRVILSLNADLGPLGAPAPSMAPNRTLEIDYVRVRKCSSAASRCVQRDADVAPTPGPPDPSFKTLKVYDGEAVVPANVDGATYTNTLEAGQFSAQATVTIDSMLSATGPRDSGEDAGNVFWSVGFMGAGGDTGRVFLGSGARSDEAVLDDGFNLSGANGIVGHLTFRMRVERLGEMTRLTVKMDGGSPNVNAGSVDLMAWHVVDTDTITADGAWHQYAVSLSELLAHPEPGGTGLRLADVRNLFVLEASSDGPGPLLAMVEIDDIYVHVACRNARATPGEDCRAEPRVVPPGDLPVFDDAVGARWDLGIGAHDGLRAGDCMGGDSASCGNVSWAIVAATDPARGEVLEISHGDAVVDDLPAFSRVYLRASAGQDLSGYDDGELRFDIMVASQGSGGSTPTFRIRVDCLPRCGSADHAVGAVGARGWQTVAVNLRRDLIGTANARGMMLDLSAVDTGLIIWPTTGMQAGVVFRLDNIVWSVAAETATRP